jgi:hypothetical protein
MSDAELNMVRASLLSIIGGMVREGQRDWSFLIAVEDGGRAYFMDVNRSGYDIRNAGVIFVGSIVDDYTHLSKLLIDIGMRHGMSEWLLMQLEERGDHTDMLRDQISALRLKVSQLENEIAVLEQESERERGANDAMQAAMYDRESHGY